MINKLSIVSSKKVCSHLSNILHIDNLKDKPDGHSDFVEPEPDPSKWMTEKRVPICDKNGNVVIVKDIVQYEKTMVLNDVKLKIGMEVWSKEYDAKRKELREFKDIKKEILIRALTNVHPNLIQQLKNIDEYKQVEKEQDLIKTLLLLRDVCFSGRDGGWYFTQWLV